MQGQSLVIFADFSGLYRGWPLQRHFSLQTLILKVRYRPRVDERPPCIQICIALSLLRTLRLAQLTGSCRLPRANLWLSSHSVLAMIIYMPTHCSRKLKTLISGFRVLGPHMVWLRTVDH